MNTPFVAQRMRVERVRELKCSVGGGRKGGIKPIRIITKN